MFLNLDKRNTMGVLAVDSLDNEITCGEVLTLSERVKLAVKPRSVAFALCNNTVGALTAYLCSVLSDVVPVMLNISIDSELLNNLIETYKPAYIWQPAEAKCVLQSCQKLFEAKGYSLYATNNETYPIHDDLELLMTTSGSTGSPKLVRYKKGNLEANAKNVAAAFGWTAEERPLCDLAINYTMGLNVVNTHIYAGATVYLTNANIMSSDYWDFIRKYQLTNLTGVPFSYELMLKLRFTRMELPYMRTLAQGGGKLADETFIKLAQFAKESGKRFVATFGTTETSARMTYLDPDLALEKVGSIGKAIPEGELFLVDEEGNRIEGGDVEGELAYSGPNVTMGYAICKEDLIKEDDFRGTYFTGDVARRDSDGFYYIVGRKSRFLKLLGYRVSLDQCERFIKGKFDTECACVGRDDEMKIFITNPKLEKEIVPFISEKTGFFKSLFKVVVVSEIPKNESGKIMYKVLK